MDQAFANLWRATGGELAEGELAPEAPPAGQAEVRVLVGEPGSTRAARVTDLLLAGAAERVWITDAYFVAPRTLYQALVDAARAGLDVRVLVPGTSDLTHLQNLTRIGYRDLLEAGIRIFEWRGPMLHAKTMVADSRWLRIGSTNLNLSSLLVNYELDVLVEDPELGQELEAQYRRDLDHSVEIGYTAGATRRSARLAALPGTSEAARRRHRPGLRERRRRAVVAVWAVVAGARRTILLQYSVALAVLGILFLLFPRIMAWAFSVLALWLAISAWLETWGRETA
jgi:cardiolipin synthase